MENDGHDVVHIDFAPELGTGTADTSIAEYSKGGRSRDRHLRRRFRESADTFRAVVDFDDVSLSPAEIADIVHRLSERYPQDELRGVESVGREWL